MTEFKFTVSVVDIEFPHELMHQLRLAGWTDPIEMQVRYENRRDIGPRYSVVFDMQRSVEAEAVSALGTGIAYLFRACTKLKDYVELDMTLTKRVVVVNAGEGLTEGGTWIVENTLSVSHPVEYFLYRIPHTSPTREDRIEHGRKILQMIALRAFLVDRCPGYDEIGIVSPVDLAPQIASLADRMFRKFKVQNN